MSGDYRGDRKERKTDFPSTKTNEIISLQFVCVRADTQQKHGVIAPFYLSVCGLAEASRPCKALCLKSLTLQLLYTRNNAQQAQVT